MPQEEGTGATVTCRFPKLCPGVRETGAPDWRADYCCSTIRPLDPEGCGINWVVRAGGAGIFLGASFGAGIASPFGPGATAPPQPPQPPQQVSQQVSQQSQRWKRARSRSNKLGRQQVSQQLLHVLHVLHVLQHVSQQLL